ncbi:hypothetical protein [Bacillus ndiopicus]|uniref:hypothetical protein n=1 Tax=Bacillus ndiopicus TaxID=1347368 RepID=UPI0005A8F3EB|nr:hypothetical protein [Bacillus ndiopicus]
MTLIVTFNIGGGASVITTDTRRIMNFFGKEIEIKDNKKNKIKKISDYTIAAVGGFEQIGDFVIKEIKREGIQDILGIRLYLNRLDAEVQKRYRRLISKDERTQIIFVGISRNGISNVLYYLPNEERLEKRIIFSILEEGVCLVNYARPEEFEIDNVINEIVIEIKKGIQSHMSTEEKIEFILQGLGYMHLVAHEHKPDKISDLMCYAAIIKADFPENIFIEGTVKLKEEEKSE